MLLDEGADVNLLDNIGLSALLACHHLLYSSYHPQLKVRQPHWYMYNYPVKSFSLKDALQCYAKEDEVVSLSSSTNSSVTEFIIPSTSALCQSKAGNASSPSGAESKPLLQSRSGTRLSDKATPISRVTSLPLLQPTNASPITTDVKQTRSFNTNMVKFTSLSSTLMNKGKMIPSGKSFPSDNRIVPDDEEQLLSSDVEVDEMPIVLESVGSHDDLMTSQTMPHHSLLIVSEAKVNEEEGNFFSSEYGPIISAAQSTTILYSATELTASLLMDTGSANSSETNLHGKRFVGNIL